MLSSTPTSLRSLCWCAKAGLLFRPAEQATRLINPGSTLNDAYLHHRQHEPQAGHVNGETRELIAGPRTKRTRPARSTQGTDQPAPLTLLDQHQENHEQANQKNDEVQRT